MNNSELDAVHRGYLEWVASPIPISCSCISMAVNLLALILYSIHVRRLNFISQGQVHIIALAIADFLGIIHKNENCKKPFKMFLRNGSR